MGGQAEETSGQKRNTRGTGAREKERERETIQGVADPFLSIDLLSVNQLRFILFKKLYVE